MGYIKEKCRVCAAPAVDGGYCVKCLDERNERVRAHNEGRR